MTMQRLETLLGQITLFIKQERKDSLQQLYKDSIKAFAAVRRKNPRSAKRYVGRFLERHIDGVIFGPERVDGIDSLLIEFGFLADSATKDIC